MKLFKVVTAWFRELFGWFAVLTRMLAIELSVKVSAEGLTFIDLLAIGVEHVPSETIKSSELKKICY